MTLPTFPPYEVWELTRQTLHAYSKSLRAIAWEFVAPLPLWWHISLTVRPDGLTTKDMPLPDGGSFLLRLDLKQHAAVLESSRGEPRTFDMTAGTSGTEFTEALIAAVRELGLQAEYNRAKFENDEPREYSKAAAETYLAAIQRVGTVFERLRAMRKEGEVGPVQFWPHNFDLAFEWFGTKKVVKEDGETAAAQLNLGFSGGDASHPDPYFYSNPWPLDEKLFQESLPQGARWFNESWKGTILPYAAVAGEVDGESRLFAYAQRVYEVAAPTLMA